jgi:signal transduction histidine kinase
MTTHIHELRNRLTTAVLTATAMLDGKLPPDRTNLQGLVHALEDVKTIVATVSKYDWRKAPSGDQIVDVQDLIRSVVDELALVSSAADVRLIAAENDSDSFCCGMLRGHSTTMHGAVEGAVHALVGALPPKASVTIAPRSAQIVALRVYAPGDSTAAWAHLADIAPHLESRGGRAYLSGEPGEYYLQLPGKPVCSQKGDCIS